MAVAAAKPLLNIIRAGCISKEYYWKLLAIIKFLIHFLEKLSKDFFPEITTTLVTNIVDPATLQI